MILRDAGLLKNMCLLLLLRRKEMKKRISCILLAIALTMSLTACGNAESTKATDSTETAESSESVDSTETDELTETLEAIGEVEADKNLFSVELTIPAEFMEGKTQDELDAVAKEKGFKSITLHEDGSATYVMTKAQHEQLMSELTDSINSSLKEMIGSEDYPNITDITANDDFTSFTIATTSSELSLNESFSVLAFYTYAGMYNIFNGTPVENVHVDFVNADSGEIIDTADSSDMNESE